MRVFISASLTLSMFLSAFMCVGMGMSMGIDAPKTADHNCCPKEKSEGGSQGPSCCMFMPSMTVGSVSLPERADELTFAVLSQASSWGPVPENGNPVSSRAPPDVKEIFLYRPAPRAPPSV